MLKSMLPVLALALLAGTAVAPAADRTDRADEKAECERVKKEIRKLQSRMRRGYRAAQGVKLNEKLLELRKRRAKVCR